MIFLGSINIFTILKGSVLRGGILRGSIGRYFRMEPWKFSYFFHIMKNARPQGTTPPNFKNGTVQLCFITIVS